MASPSGPPRAAALLRPDRRWPLAALLIVLAVALAYADAWHTPFVFDDVPSIVDNASLRRLWPPSADLLLPRRATEAGRPVLNLSLALNYAAGGLRVTGYHAANLAIHAACALLLLGLARRTLRRMGHPAAAGAAAALALLWAVHPLQTESVTYVIQRAESLMALFYLATLYAFARSADAAGGAAGRWRAAAVAACALGMAAKEVMVSAPVAVLLYDRAFVAGEFRAAWRARRRFYLALAATWLVLLVCVWVEGSRENSAGFDTGVSCWRYAAAQLCALPRYLRLAVWPSPLVFYYGPLAGANLAPRLGPALLGAALLALIVAGTLIGLRRNRPAGFLGAAALLILAPTSTLLPIATEPVAEHRLYLPLAAVLCVVVPFWRRFRAFALPPTLVAAAVLAFLTWQRNRTYASALALWADTVRHAPENFTAQNNLGLELLAAGRRSEAQAAFEVARRQQPGYAEPWVNLGHIAALSGNRPAAIADYREAIRLRPDYAEAHNDLGAALLEQPGFHAEAVAEFARALQFKPGLADAQNNWGNALAAEPGRDSEAIAHYREALRLRPGYADAHYNLANVLSRSPDRVGEAIAEYRRALALDPRLERAQLNLGNAFARLGRPEEAIPCFEAALRLDPSDAQAHLGLGLVLARGSGGLSRGIAELRAAARLDPNNALAHANLGVALFRSGQARAAADETRKALQLDPGLPGAAGNLERFERAAGE
ncbi:MAG TPA: tetratricopeptide repeat protein [Opitutaceae bacterium]|jgi:tetratricopeptide (TPR) repeat protein|nr:tetratricopeptide repeat protein [Opitutaceae bacterium]